MKDFIRKHKVLSVMVAFVVFTVSFCELWEPSASLRGHVAARFDLARARYQLLVYGFPSPCRDEYARLLRQRYGIEFRAVAFCIVSKSLCSYADAYDDTVEAAAIGKFGHDVFKECWEEARTNCALKTPTASKD